METVSTAIESPVVNFRVDRRLEGRESCSINDGARLTTTARGWSRPHIRDREIGVGDEQRMDPSASVADAEARAKRHEAEEAHHTTVEDAIDEDDGDNVQHPPMANGDDARSPDASIATNPAGKQSATAGPPERPNEKLDTASHEAFPCLGGGTATRPVGTAWGTQKPPPVSTRADPLPALAAVNGDRGHGSAASAAASQPSSRRSTPASSGLTAPIASPSAAHHQRVLAPQTVSIPGQHSERISLLPREMKPRSQLKKPVLDVLRDINRKSKANVQMSSGAAGAVHFDARGPVDAVRQALKDLAKELGSKVSLSSTVKVETSGHTLTRSSNLSRSRSQPRSGRTSSADKERSSRPSHNGRARAFNYRSRMRRPLGAAAATTTTTMMPLPWTSSSKEIPSPPPWPAVRSSRSSTSARPALT